MSDTESDLGLTPVRKVRTHQEVLRKLQEAIFEGRLKPGDRLPGERQLSETLGVSRASVREALRVLEALDVIRARTGSGQESGSIIETEPDDALPNLLALYVALNHFDMPDVIEVRQIVEEWAAMRAASLAKDEDVQTMASLLTAMEDESLSPGEFHEIDTRFHLAIVSAAENKLLSYLMRALRTAVQRRMREAFDSAADWPALARQLRTEHRHLFEAIQAGDPKLAGNRVREHLTGFYDRVDASVHSSTS